MCIDSALGRAMIGSFTVHNSRGWLVKTIHCGQRGQIRCGEHSLKEKGACIDSAFGRVIFRHMHHKNAHLDNGYDLSYIGTVETQNYAKTG